MTSSDSIIADDSLQRTLFWFCLDFFPLLHLQISRWASISTYDLAGGTWERIAVNNVQFLERLYVA